MKTVGVVFLAGLVAALAVGTSFAARDLGLKIGEGSARGEFAEASAFGRIVRPRVIRMQVVARPPQPIQAAYTMTCEKDGVPLSISKTIEADAPLTRKMQMPYARPDNCPVISDRVQLRDGGALKVKLYATFRRSRSGG